MTTKFSYQSLRCIIEYLEANKRIHITSRSQALQNIEKNIPLHIDELDFPVYCIRINSITYNAGFDDFEGVLVGNEFRSWMDVLMPGDILLESDPRARKTYFNLDKDRDLEIRGQHIRRATDNMQFSRMSTYRHYQKTGIPIPSSTYLPLKFVTNVLLGHRTTIHVSTFHPSFINRLPASIKLRVRNLETRYLDFRPLLPIIDPLSFPLKHLSTFPSNPEMYYHPVLQTAETLTVYSSTDLGFVEPWDQLVLTLPHKHITIHSQDYIRFIRRWLENPKEIGETLIIYKYQSDCLRTLIEIKEEFNGKVVPLKKVERNCCKAILIPINSTLDLLVSNTPKGIKLETVPVGSTKIKNGLDLNEWDVHYEKYFVHYNFLLLIVAVSVVLVCSYILLRYYV